MGKSINYIVDGEMYRVYPSGWIDYITTKRVEINSVTEELNDNQKFWDWIVDKLRAKFTNWDYTRTVDIPEYVMPKPLELLSENFREIGTAILSKQQKKLRDNLSDIGPGLLFDRTDKVLQDQQSKKGKGDVIMTITKYEEVIAEQEQGIIESDKILKPFLEKIEDLNNQLLEQPQQQQTQRRYHQCNKSGHSS
jgi:hypothetical protein